MVHLYVDICRNHGLCSVRKCSTSPWEQDEAGRQAGRARLLDQRGPWGEPVMKMRSGKDARVRGETSLRQRGRTCSWTPQRPAGAGHRKARSQSRRREAQEGIGIRIRAMRRSKGWSQEVFAEKCGIDPSLLGVIERGNQNLGLGTLLPIAATLETTVAKLFTGIA